MGAQQENEQQPGLVSYRKFTPGNISFIIIRRRELPETRTVLALIFWSYLDGDKK